jgi:hypothetical protein
MKYLKLCIVIILVLTCSVGALAGTLAYWEFNEEDPGTTTVFGQRIIDSSGNGRDLFVDLGTEGTTSFVEPNPDYGTGAAMGFTVDENRLIFEPGHDFGDGGPLAGSKMSFGVFDSFTMECLVRFPTRNDDQGLFCAPLGAINGTTGVQIWWRVRNNNNLQFYLVDDLGAVSSFNVVPGSTAPGGSTIPNLYDGNWHHWAIVRDTDTSELRMFVDYILVAEVTDTTGVLDPDVEWGIGSWNYGYTSRSFVGSMDFMRISDTALSPSGFVQPIAKPLPTNPSPADNAIEQAPASVNLSWTPISDPNFTLNVHTVTVATDPAMTDVVTVINSISGSSTTITNLDNGRAYFWRVDSQGTYLGNPEFREGDVWSFSTVDASTIAGFWEFDDKDPGTALDADDQVIDSSANNRDLYVVTEETIEIGEAIYGNPDAEYGSNASYEGYSDNQLALEPGRVFGASDIAGSQLSIPGDGDITFEAVVKFNLGESDRNAIITTLMSPEDNYFYGTGLPQYWFRTETSGVVRLWMQNETETALVAGTTNVYDGEWHHVAAVRDTTDGKLRIYVDYVLDAEVDDAITADVVPSGMTVVGGFDGYTSRNFEGNIDFVKVTRDALDPVDFVQSVGTVSNPVPVDTATGIPSAFTFSWTAIPGATITSETLVLATDPYMQNVDQTVAASGSSANVTGLQYNTTYYWRVDTEGSDAGGAFSRKGPIWSFDTQSCSLTIEEGDLNQDCEINLLDFTDFAGNWLESGL